MLKAIEFFLFITLFVTNAIYALTPYTSGYSDLDPKVKEIDVMYALYGINEKTYKHQYHYQVPADYLFNTINSFKLFIKNNTPDPIWIYYKIPGDAIAHTYEEKPFYNTDAILIKPEETKLILTLRNPKTRSGFIYSKTLIKADQMTSDIYGYSILDYNENRHDNIWIQIFAYKNDHKQKLIYDNVIVKNLSSVLAHDRVPTQTYDLRSWANWLYEKLNENTVSLYLKLGEVYFDDNPSFQKQKYIDPLYSQKLTGLKESDNLNQSKVELSSSPLVVESEIQEVLLTLSQIKS